MGIIYTPPFSIEDAISRGNDVYEVLFAGWGVTDGPPATVYTNLQFPQPGQPGIPTSVSAIAIGPKSTVDRCWLSYNPGKRRTPNDPKQAENILRALSVESPLVFTQASSPNKYNNPGAIDDPVTTLADTGAFYVFPFSNHQAGGGGDPISFDFPQRQDTTVLPPNYRDVNGATQTFSFGVNARGMQPFLHLYLYLKTPVLFPPVRRSPLMTQGQRLIPLNSQGDELLVAQVPTFGRRHVRITVFNGQAASWRVGALRAIGQVAGMIESPVATASTAGGTPYAFELPNHYADYTNLYVTPGTNLGTTARFQVSAYD